MRKYLSYKLPPYVALSVIPVIVLFFISPDAPTHYLYERCDSANFFMCGKAWMNGMVPYVDFTDSKGPLLWLLYGLGYLLSPRDYVGVYVVSCVAYAFTYCLTYKMSMLFLNDKRKSVCCCLLMTIFYFMPLYHYETRAEDFCIPFVLLDFLCTYKTIMTEQHSRSVIRKASFFLGVALGATILIKYTIAIIPIVSIAFVLWYRKSVLFSVMAWCVVGFLAILLPFAVCFAYMGNLGDFIDQYFLVTLQTVKNLQTEHTGNNNLLQNLVYNSFVIFLLVLAAVTPLWTRYMKEGRLLPFVSLGVFLMVCSSNAHWPYYYCVCSVYFIFAILPCVGSFPSFQNGFKAKGVILSTLVIVFAIIANYHYYYYSIDSVGLHNLIFQKDNDQRRAYQFYSDYIAGHGRKPRIIYIDSQCAPEYGVEAEALPGCRDWSQQNGASFQMKESAWEAIRHHQADFVVAKLPESFVRLQELGYVMIQNESVGTVPKLFVYSKTSTYFSK